MFFSYKEFEGNTDQHLVVRHLMKNPINVTRYIRIYPVHVAWYRWRISLRADFYGCKSGMLEYAIIFSLSTKVYQIEDFIQSTVTARTT